ncbi:endonuclease [Actinomycetia phage DSL-LC01]|nr:endonuclease [Actinomycetia phage DSL-LC01]
MPTVTTTTSVKTTEDVAVLDPSAEALLIKFNEAKAAIKALEAEKAAAEKAIRELLNGANVGTINGVERVRVQHRNMSKIDREALKMAYPEAYSATLVESAYTVLQTK